MGLDTITSEAGIPQLLIEYKPNEERESLIFINNGATTLKNIGVGTILWSTAHRREINIHYALALRAKEHVEVKFAVFEHIGNSRNIAPPLREIIREIAQKGCEAEPEVTVSYEDMIGNQFYRIFTLAVDAWNHVVWNPGSVYPDFSESEAD